MPRLPLLSTGRCRIALGRDLRLIEAHRDELWIEGPVRLRPGQAVELIGQWPVGVETTRARVITWRVVRLTREGPYYRGCCRLEP